MAEEPQNMHHCRVQPWPATAALIVAEIVGTGVLALGGAFSKVGWATGLLVLCFGLVLSVCTSLLLNLVHLYVPSSVTLGDAMTVINGRAAGYMGYAFLYTYLFLTMANYIIVLSKS